MTTYLTYVTLDLPNNGGNGVFVISLNFRRAEVSFREVFAFSADRTNEFLSSLRSAGITEAVYLSTCNRCELYGEGSYMAAIGCLSEFSCVSEGDIKRRVLIFDGDCAIQHLFSVACGLDSMVKGEDEILGQVKSAFSFSMERGFTGYHLNTIFKSAVTAAKRVKTDTLVSKTSVSVATLAAAECKKFAEAGAYVLLIGGSGEVGEVVLKNLLSYGIFEIAATVRTRHMTSRDVTLLPYDDRYDYIDRADIVISATKSPHFTITASRLGGMTEKRRLFLDLAVPRDIDNGILRYPDVTLMTVDDFRSIAADNAKIKEREFDRAGEFLRQSVNDLVKELKFHSLIPVLENNVGDDIKRFIYRYRDAATADEFQSFADVILRMEGEK